MQYMILIHNDESGWSRLTPEQQAEGMQAYMAYTGALREAGAYVQSGRLQPAAATKRVTVRNGRESVVDGPFADTKEQLGGFFLIEAKSEAEALDWAAKCPGAHRGVVEVRALVMR